MPRRSWRVCPLTERSAVQDTYLARVIESTRSRGSHVYKVGLKSEFG